MPAPGGAPVRRKRSFLSTILFIAIAVAAVLGWKLYNKASTSSKIERDLIAYIASHDLQPEDLAFCESRVHEIHPDIFDSCYRLGGRRSGAKFDQEKYVHSMLGRLAADANQAGRPTLGATLTILDATTTLEPAGN